MSHSLRFTLHVMPVRIRSAMAVDRALRVELIVALSISGRTTIAPNPFALRTQRRTIAIETIALPDHFAQRRFHLATLVAVLFVHITRTGARLAHTILGNVALVARLPTHQALRLQFAALAAQSVGAFRLHFQLARDAVAARILFAVLEAAAVALFVVLDDFVAAIAAHLQFVGFVQQAQAVADAQRIDVVLFAAVAEFVRLHVVQADN